MEIKKVAIYARVSTEEQAKEGYSITAQLQTLRQYA
jgi:site-specific DNA recombinase